MAGAHSDDEGLDDKAREGIDHLQAAAKEMIQAARTMLDLVEDLVDDPAVQEVVGTLGSFATAAAARIRHSGESVGEEDGSDDPDAGRVRPIRLS